MQREVKIVCISDTHMRHREIKIPDGDILIHAGDIINALPISPIFISTMYDNFMDFIKWFSDQPHRLKIFIAGNHDIVLDETLVGAELKSKILKQLPPNVIYLENTFLNISIYRNFSNQGRKLIKQIKFYGIPNGANHGPAFVFASQEGEKLENPKCREADIIIIHTPPYGILDTAPNGSNAGSKSLTKFIDSRGRKEGGKKYIFGHIHEGYGRHEDTKNNLFINASIRGGMREPNILHEPICISF